MAYGERNSVDMDLCIFWFSSTCFTGHATRAAHISRKWDFWVRSATGAHGQQMILLPCTLAVAFFFLFWLWLHRFQYYRRPNMPVDRFHGAFFFLILLYAHLTFFFGIFLHIYFLELYAYASANNQADDYNAFPPTILLPKGVPVSRLQFFSSLPGQEPGFHRPQHPKR